MRRLVPAQNSILGEIRGLSLPKIPSQPEFERLRELLLN